MNLDTGEVSGSDPGVTNAINVAPQLNGLVIREDIHSTALADAKSGAPLTIQFDYVSTASTVEPVPPGLLWRAGPTRLAALLSSFWRRCVRQPKASRVKPVEVDPKPGADRLGRQPGGCTRTATRRRSTPSPTPARARSSPTGASGRSGAPTGSSARCRSRPCCPRPTSRTPRCGSRSCARSFRARWRASASATSRCSPARSTARPSTCGSAPACSRCSSLRDRAIKDFEPFATQVIGHQATIPSWEPLPELVGASSD